MKFLLALLMVLPSLAGAVDLTVYRFSLCQGDGVVFSNIQSEACTKLDIQPISKKLPMSLFYSGGSNCGSTIFFDDGCSNVDQTKRGSACLTNENGIPSTRWKECVLRRQLLSDLPSPSTDPKGPCIQPKIAGVVYTEDAGKGTWVLMSPDAPDFATELATVAEAEKVEWFRARGAWFQLATEPLA